MEAGDATLAEGGDALVHVVGPPGCVERGEHLRVLAASDRHLQGVQSRLVRGDRERCQGRDLVGPAEGGFQVAQPLHQAQPVGVLAPQGLGAEQHRPGGSVPRQARQALDGPLVDGEPQLGRRYPEAGCARGDPEIAGHRQLRPGAEGGAVDGSDHRPGIVVQRGEDLVETGCEAFVLHAGKVGTRAEGVAGSCQHEHPGAGRGTVHVEQPVERLAIEGIAPFGPVDGHQCNGAPVLEVDHGAPRRHGGDGSP